MYIKRKAENILKIALKSKKVLIILGARQVGKTTLIKHFLANEKIVFLNLDIEVDRNRFVAMSSLNPNEAMKSIGNPKYLIIDEAQRLNETGRIIKGWYDAEVKTKIVLLGSSSLDLINQSSESLTGRNEKIFLSPMLFPEIIENQTWYSSNYDKTNLTNNFGDQINSLLMNLIVFGSYPEVFLTDDKQKYLLNLVSDYLLKDVLQIGLVRNPELIRKLLMLLAYQAGSEISVHELANNLKMSAITVEKYLSLLEETYVIFRLPAFSTNPRKEISRSQKVYFVDTGVRNAILNEFSLNHLRSDIGGLWENWVIAEIFKQNLLFGQKRNLYFWRSKAKSEVDLIIKENEQISAYEIKWKKKKANKKAFENAYKTKVEIISREDSLVMMNLLG
jgi:predicted AAA+ superfamily ATPase